MGKIHAKISLLCRKKRFKFFQEFIGKLPRPLKILDIGGTQRFWDDMNFIADNNIHIILYNIDRQYPANRNFSFKQGNALNMENFLTDEFDIVFSNSCIEHLGCQENQKYFSDETQRIGKHYFIQTPNRYFPIEPHFLIPFFQFFPIRLKIFLLTYLKIGRYQRTSSRTKTIQYINSIRLISQKELKWLFPHAKIYKEKFLGLTKSLIAYY